MGLFNQTHCQLCFSTNLFSRQNPGSIQVWVASRQSCTCKKSRLVDILISRGYLVWMTQYYLPLNCFPIYYLYETTIVLTMRVLSVCFSSPRILGLSCQCGITFSLMILYSISMHSLSLKLKQAHQKNRRVCLDIRTHFMYTHFMHM